MSDSSTKVWFRLLDDHNRLTTTDSVPVGEKSTIKRFRDAVFNKVSRALPEKVTANNLQIYSRGDYVSPIHETVRIGSMGRTKETALVIMVQTSTDVSIAKVGGWSACDMRELRLYQERGRLIRENCEAYCNEILDKIDEYYRSGDDPLPFICVQGSSGMGKTQLAFALGGRRPWFYWLGITLGECSQNIYQNFNSISSIFQTFVDRDDPSEKNESIILNAASSFYVDTELWTYGFIRALLEYCRSQTRRQMILFEDKPTLTVEKCDRKTVLAVVNEMKAEERQNEQEGKAGEKVVPFFILDEMAIKANGGKNKVAFQRNVFRACGLLVMVMGTDPKINDLAEQPEGSSAAKHRWMTVVPRFPSYQLLLSTQDSQQIWPEVVATYPVVKEIVQRSRGRFSRYFVDEVVKCWVENSSIGLGDLLDKVFAHVSLKTHSGKGFMCSSEGRHAQKMAIFFTNVLSDCAGEPEPKKRRVEAQTAAMHVHFANLEDEDLTDVDMSVAGLCSKNELWQPRCCFPAIEEDVLLYLAILESALTAQERDSKNHEDMVAHAMFSSSRRSGVRGIPFLDFLIDLFGEFQAKRWTRMVLHDKDGGQINARSLFEGYGGTITELLDRRIPFLAPPNAEWPQCILDTNALGCKFGQLVRRSNTSGCEITVQDVENKKEKGILLSECKYSDQSLDLSSMKGVLDRLDEVWGEDWAFVLLFCVNPTGIPSEWTEKNIGCVKINCQGSSAVADWVFEPEREHRNKLVMIVETGFIQRAGYR